MPLGTCHSRAPYGSTSHEPIYGAILRFRAVQHAGLENLVCCGETGLGNDPGVVYRVCERSFAVYMLTCLKRVKHQVLVLVCGCGNEDSYDFRIVEDFSVIGDTCSLWVGALGSTKHQWEVVANDR